MIQVETAGLGTKRMFTDNVRTPLSLFRGTPKLQQGIESLPTSPWRRRELEPLSIAG